MSETRKAPATGREVITAETGKKILWQLAQVADSLVLDHERAQRLIEDENGLEEFGDMLWHVHERGKHGSYLQGPAFYFDRETRIIRWSGTWTQGRFVAVQFGDDEAILTWDSATGKPSSYIGYALTHMWKDEEVILKERYAHNPRLSRIGDFLLVR